MVRKLKNGTKLYPVCSFEANQHKLYNALDRARLREYEEGYTEEVSELIERIEKALDAFNRHVVGNTVYATYADSILIKEIITTYDVRHDMAGDWKTE